MMRNIASAHARTRAVKTKPKACAMKPWHKCTTRLKRTKKKRKKKRAAQRRQNWGKKTKLGDLSMMKAAKSGLAKKITTGRPTLQKAIDVIAEMPEKVSNEEDARAMMKHFTTLQAQVDELQENHNADDRRKDQEAKERQGRKRPTCQGACHQSRARG